MVVFRTASPTLCPQFAYSLAYGPKLGIVGVGLEASLVGETQHLVVDARGIANAQYGNAPIDQFLRDPVHRHVALCAHQHLALAHQCLVDGLDERRRLSCARRAVDDHHVLGAHYLADGLLLGAVEPRQAHWTETIGLCWLGTVEKVAQVGQAVALCRDHAVEGIEHLAIARLVKRELATDLLSAVGLKIE